MKKHRQKNRGSVRRINYGQGSLFDFHGAYNEKAQAVQKEKKVPGAFIRTVWYKDGPRYGVLTKKNAGGQDEIYKVAKSAGWAAANEQMRKAGRTKWSQADRELAAKIQNDVLDELGYENPKKSGKKRQPGKTAKLRAKRLSSHRQSRSSHKKPGSSRRNARDAEQLYEQFHGKRHARVTDTGLPIADYDSHPKLAALGKLVSVTIGENVKLIEPKFTKAQPLGKGKPWVETISFGSNEAPDLAAEPGGRQLYLVGGNQNISDCLRSLPIDANKDLLDLGNLLRLEYFTRKGFDNFQPVTYYHALGEETGVTPRLIFDRRKKRLHIVGGQYEVKPEGIVN
jgi:hypothetical protein